MAKNKQGFGAKIKNAKNAIAIVTSGGIIVTAFLFASIMNKINFRPMPDTDFNPQAPTVESGDIEADIHTVAPHPSINTETESNYYIESESNIHMGNEPTINTETESNMYIPQETEKTIETNHEVVTEPEVGTSGNHETSTEKHSSTETQTSAATETESNTEYHTETESNTMHETESITERFTETETESHYETESATEARPSESVENATVSDVVSRLTAIAQNYIKKVSGTSKAPEITNMIISQITPDADNCEVTFEGSAYINGQGRYIKFSFTTHNNTLAIYQLVNYDNTKQEVDIDDCVNAISEILTKGNSYNVKFKVTGKINEYEAETGLVQ